MKQISVLLALLFLCAGCSTAVYQRGEYISACHSGDVVRAENAISKTISKEIPENNPFQSNDSTWLLLDRATIRFAIGDIQGAIDDYRAAIDVLDYFNQSSLMESLGKVVLQDELGAYAGEDYEQVLARVYLALALIHQGDMSNAYAILRQGEELQQKKRKEYLNNAVTQHFQLIDNAVNKYLFAALLEKRGDPSNAAILYRQASQLTNQADLFENLRASSATILVVCHNGNAPYKISTITDASIASGLALEIILSSNNITPACSSLAGVPTPDLRNWPFSQPSPTFACVDGFQKPLLPLINIGETAQQQLNQEMPLIVARGVARFLMRRCAVGYAQEHDPNVGALVDFAMFLANLTTKADTRSWTTLPNEIDFTRFDVCPGNHKLTIQVSPYGMPIQPYQYNLTLSANDLCVINVFNIHPRITYIQVPQRFSY